MQPKLINSSRVRWSQKGLRGLVDGGLFLWRGPVTYLSFEYIAFLKQIQRIPHFFINTGYRIFQVTHERFLSIHREISQGFYLKEGDRFRQLINRDDQSGLKHIDLKQAKKLFVFSILSIIVLSVMMSIDFTVPAPSDMLLTYAP
jgi:hypothetical protein